jgi:hypothetical protein
MSVESWSKASLNKDYSLPYEEKSIPREQKASAYPIGLTSHSNLRIRWPSHLGISFIRTDIRLSVNELYVLTYGDAVLPIHYACAPTQRQGAVMFCPLRAHPLAR